MQEKYIPSSDKDYSCQSKEITEKIVVETLIHYMHCLCKWISKGILHFTSNCLFIISPIKKKSVNIILPIIND